MNHGALPHLGPYGATQASTVLKWRNAGSRNQCYYDVYRCQKSLWDSTAVKITRYMEYYTYMVS